MRFFILILCLSLSIPVFAQAEETDIELTEEEFSDFEKDNPQLYGRLKELEKNTDDFTPLEVKDQLPVRQSSKPFHALLKENSVLIDIDRSSNKIKTPTNLYVMAIRSEEDSQIFFIYNKKGKIKYRTLAKNLHSFEQDIQLLPRPESLEHYPPPTTFQEVDEKLTLNNFINARSEYLAAGSKASEYELKTFFAWRIPLEFGLAISTQNGKEPLDTDWANWQAVYFGPHLRYVLKDRGYFDYSFDIGFEKSLSYSRSTTESEQKLSSDLFHLEADLIWPTFLGRLLVGINYRTIRNSLESTNNPDDSVWPNQDRHTALGFVVGYGFSINI